MEQTLLNVLYGVLILLILVVGGLLAVVLWQLSLAIAQARTTLLPQVQQLLHDAERSLSEVEHITGDVQLKLKRLDPTVEAVDQAVGSVAKTTTMLSTTLARPAIARLAILGAGIQGALGYLGERRKTSVKAGPAPRRKALVE